MINNTRVVCNQEEEGCPALRKADPPSSQAYSCHSVLTYANRAREQVGFKRNKLPKYGSEKTFEKSSIENYNNTKRNQERFKGCVVWTQCQSPVHNFTDFRGRRRKSVKSPFSNGSVFFSLVLEGGRPIKSEKMGEEEDQKNQIFSLSGFSK